MQRRAEAESTVSSSSLIPGVIPLMKSVALRAATSSGFAGLFRPMMKRVAVIFMLHRFTDRERGISGYDPSSVRALLEYLRRERYALVSLEALFAAMSGEGPPLSHALAFTIDDGYVDHAEIAAPMFASFDCPVTTFVATGFLDGSLWFWWDHIQYVFRRTARPSLKLSVGDSTLEYRLSDAESRQRAEDDFVARCKTLPEHRKLAVIRELSIAAEVEIPREPPAAYAPMTWSQLRECERRGMTFAPHTVTHPILACATDEQARAEIVDSWARLRSEAQRPVPILAYPNGQPGDFGAREYQLLRDTGLRGAVTSVAGFATQSAHRSANGEFLVPRFSFPESLPYLIQQVSGIERLKFLIRGDR